MSKSISVRATAFVFSLAWQDSDTRYIVVCVGVRWGFGCDVAVVSLRVGGWGYSIDWGNNKLDTILHRHRFCVFCCFRHLLDTYQCYR